MNLSLVVATAKGNAIGRDGALPWGRVSDDLRRFRSLTMGHPVIMGRATYQSLPEAHRPLPGRTNIVLSRTLGELEGCLVAASPEQALAQAAKAPGGEEAFVIGGAQIYQAFLPLAGRIYLTELEAEVEGADAFFPTLTDQDWQRQPEGSFLADERNAVSGRFFLLCRR